MKCKICGQEVPDYRVFPKEGVCYDCDFWSKKVKSDKTEEPYRVVIINGTHYYIGDEDSQSGFRGFGGAKFYIEFNDGTKVETTNLWCQGEIPSLWREKFPDNAKFCNNNWKWKNINGVNYLVDDK